MLRYQALQPELAGFRNWSGPISPCSNWAMKMPSGRRQDFSSLKKKADRSRPFRQLEKALAERERHAA